MAESMTGGRDKIEQTDFSRFNMSYWFKFSFCLRKPNICVDIFTKFFQALAVPFKKIKNGESGGITQNAGGWEGGGCMTNGCKMGCNWI